MVKAKGYSRLGKLNNHSKNSSISSKPDRESKEYEEEGIKKLVESNEEDENIEMCNSVFDNTGQETPRISLNALSGVNSYQTMREVLKVMRHNKLFAKKSKCSFAVKKVDYLGHVITGERVATDPSKIEAIKNWPVPFTLKQLSGFLGLTGYHRRFIKSYAMAMMEALVLGLLDFDQEFIIETDSSGTGFRAVLCQNGHPLAYLNKTLSVKHQSLSTYEKEFMAVVAALEKWKRYLLDRHFKIKTDHFSLKYMLNQKLTTPFQLKWLPKLLGYDYEIVSKKASDVMNKIKASWKSDDTMQQVIKSLKDNSYKGAKLALDGGLKERQNYGRQFVKEYDTCQRQKPDLSAYPGFLQPLPIPERFWTEVENADRTLQSREKVVKMLKFYMKRAQDRMESLAKNKHKTDREFEVGNWVYLKLQPHRQVTVRQGQQHILSAKYYGPFFIDERIGKGQQMGSLPHLKEDVLLDYKPMAIWERRLGKVNNKPVILRTNNSLRKMELIRIKNQFGKVNN
uniref:Reverse transcriptase RNase H-like domain-containing protein n=1 Tax=Tanacetum cinerariifolium TaxID=118510 RepID=A0A6L2MQS1_TANCI|nr:hypothetical protein [Tanacetum cinerariifolium]